MAIKINLITLYFCYILSQGMKAVTDAHQVLSKLCYLLELIYSFFEGHLFHLAYKTDPADFPSENYISASLSSNFLLHLVR